MIAKVTNLPMTAKGAILLLLCLSVSTTSFGQVRPTVTANYQHTPLSTIIKSLEESHDVRFLYLQDWVFGVRVTVSAENMSVDRFLRELTKATDLFFFMNKDRDIIVSKSRVNPLLRGNFFYQTLSSEEDVVAVEEGSILDEVREDIAVSNSLSKRLFEIGNPKDRFRSKEGVLTGRISDPENNEPLPGATVVIKGTTRGTVADNEGIYSLRLPKGQHTLVYQSIGMQDTYRKVMIYDDGKLDVEVMSDLQALDEVIVTAEQSSVNNIQTGLTKIDMKSLNQVPTLFGEADITKVVFALPGVQSAGEGASGFNVRGGRTDQNLILLDNVPVYNTNHLFGFFTAFNSDLLESAELYKGGIQAQYGGRVSSVFDVRIRDGDYDKFRAKGGIGPITGKVSVEGPIKQDTSSYILGLRSTYSDWPLKLLSDPALQNSSAFFADATAKVSFKLPEGNRLSVSGHHSRDRFRLNSDTVYRYFNNNFAIQWKKVINDNLNLNLSGTLANHSFGLEDASDPSLAFEMDYQVNQTNVNADFDYFPKDDHKVKFGLNTTTYGVTPLGRSPLGTSSLIVENAPAKESGLETALYIGDEYRQSEKLTIYGGFRLSMFNRFGPVDQYTFAPGLPRQVSTISDTISYKRGQIVKTYATPEFRFSARYKLADDFSIKASFDKMSQYIHQLTNSIAVSPTDTWKLSNSAIKPQKGNQVSLGLFKEFHKSQLEISTVGFYKKLKNLLEYKNGADLILNEVLEADIVSAEGRSYGLEFLFKKKAGQLNGWVSYTYARTFVKANGFFPDERINDGEEFPASFDQPHNLNVITNYKFTKRINLSVNFTYRTGRPVTLPVTSYEFNGTTFVNFSKRNQFNIPDYVRLDFAANFEGNHRVHKKIHGSWSFSVYNLLGRSNAYSVFFRKSGNDLESLKLSVFNQAIPTLTYNFRML